MQELKIVIPGVPTPQPRVRIYTRGGHARAWDPAHNAKKKARAIIAEQVDKMLHGAIEMDITFFLPVPKSTSKKRRAMMLSNEIKHVKRPDTDNYCKFYLDVLGSAIKDDSQIWNIHAEKRYSEEPRTVIILRGE